MHMHAPACAHACREAAVQRVLKAEGHIDVLVNNAGQFSGGFFFAFNDPNKEW